MSQAGAILVRMESRSRRFVDWWVRDRETGRVMVAQAPNPALVVFAAATLARWFDVLAADTMRAVATGALLVWGLDELTRGANPFRRMLGLAVLGWQLVSLLS